MTNCLRTPAITACLLLASSPSTAALDPADSRATITACERLLADYAIYRDHLDADEFANTFSANGVLVLGSGTSRGRAEIRENITSRPSPSVAHMILLTTIKITPVDEYNATGFSYAIILNGNRPVSAGDPPIPINGITAAVEYHTEFVLTDEGWKISRLELKPAVRGPGIA